MADLELSELPALLTAAEAVLLDLGGVLVADAWEAVVLGAGGVAERLDVDRELARAAGRAIWGPFAIEARPEHEYWAALARELGLEAIDEGLVEAAAAATMRPLPGGARLLAAVRASGRPAGVITDNAAFLFARHARLLEMDEWLEPSLRFTSFETGLRKKSGLFEHAAARTAPRRVLLIDDRAHYVERAAACGFQAWRFDGRDGGGAPASEEDLRARLYIGACKRALGK